MSHGLHMKRKSEVLVPAIVSIDVNGIDATMSMQQVTVLHYIDGDIDGCIDGDIDGYIDDTSIPSSI